MVSLEGKKEITSQMPTKEPAANQKNLPCTFQCLHPWEGWQFIKHFLFASSSGQETPCHIQTERKKQIKEREWASLVAQWLRIRLPMQGTRVRALVQEDPTCHGAAKPVRHNY